MTALVVVDMQHGFDCSANPACIDECRKLIADARLSKEPIILLRHASEGPIREPILEAVADYPRALVQPKKYYEGGEEVVQACQQLNARPRAYRICGIELFSCVKKTAFELAELRPKASVEIWLPGCHDTIYGPDDPEEPFEYDWYTVPSWDGKPPNLCISPANETGIPEWWLKQKREDDEYFAKNGMPDWMKS